MKVMRHIARRIQYAILFLMTAYPAHACDVTQWNAAIGNAAKVQHVNAALIRAVIQVESNACERLNDKHITSEAGAMGLMQLLPTTWSSYRDRLKLGDDPYDTSDNILAGSAYLHDLIQELGLFDGLAAYFAGAKTIAEHQSDEELPSSATMLYVHDVLELVARETVRSTTTSPPSHTASSALYAIAGSIDRRTVDTSRPSRSTPFAITHARKDDRSAEPDRSEPVQ